MILNRKGFTLVEVMITVGMLGVLLICVQAVLRFGIADSGKSANYYEYKIQARYAMNRIISQIKTNVGTTFDSVNNQIKASNGTTVLINATPWPSEEDGDIYYYFEPDRYGTGDGYGELRGQNGRVIAKDIKDFKIEYDDTIDPTHKLLKVTIKSGRRNDGQFFQFATYTQLY